jgi:transcriptional regulator with XRE-family HTH domain
VVKVFPERLRELRKIKGITQIALSEQLNVSKGTVAIVRVIQTITLKENAVKMEEDKNFEQKVQERERQEAIAHAHTRIVYIYIYL